MFREKHTISIDGKQYEVIVKRNYEFEPYVKFKYYEVLPERKFLVIRRIYKGSKVAFPDQIMNYSLKSLAEAGLKDVLVKEKYNVELNERMKRWEWRI